MRVAVLVAAELLVADVEGTSFEIVILILQKIMGETRFLVNWDSI